MDDVGGVEVGDGCEDLLDYAGGVAFGEFAVFADAVEEFAAGGELGYDVVFVLGGGGGLVCRKWEGARARGNTLDSNQSRKETI